ncbi:MAG: glycosyl transferase, group 1 family protein [Phenylobacterium sp.]|nr:glycosyl transferase, group 1 family protein [Phenylobacterium sp.]
MRSVALRVRRGVLQTFRRFHPDREIVEAEFDGRFYLRAHPDVARAGLDPVEHFLVSGWREGRDPNRDFSVREYLEANPDVAEAGMNPFVHYLRAGRTEGRSPRQDLGFRYEILAKLTTMDARMAEAAKASAAVRASPPAQLARALATSRAGLKGLHITFSHDDYSVNLGGVQLCVQREAAAVARAGRDHLHLFPAKPWPALRVREPALLGVVWNGEPVGFYSAAAVAEALTGRAAGGSFAIHSLLGHSVKETLLVLGAAGLKRGFFWLHDFASLCAGFHLLRNDVEDCAAPPPESAACGVCIYGPWRARHLAEHVRLFRQLDLTVVSPSQPTLDLWRSSGSFRTKGEVVAPHARLVARGPAPAGRAGRPLKVAFVGLPAAHKGWPVFRELVLRFADDRRYEFHHFGAQAPAGLPVAFHAVSANGYEAKAMQKALAAAQVDVALIWPLCRETFSFTAHEAVAAGAAILTHPDSGNVAAFVEAGGHGRVLAGEEALAAAFETGDIEDLARARRGAKLYDLEFSALTMDLISPDHVASGAGA